MTYRRYIGFCLGLLLCLSVQAVPLEVRWLHDVNSADNLHGFSRVLSTSAYVGAVALPVVQGVVALAVHDDQQMKYAITSLVGIGFDVALTQSVKAIARRERPYNRYPDELLVPEWAYKSSWSMPSGHTSMAFLTATSLTMQYRKWYISVPMYIWATGVAWSRMNVGVHYPTDVLCGAVIGAGSAVASWYLNQWFWQAVGQPTIVKPKVQKSQPDYALY